MENIIVSLILHDATIVAEIKIDTTEYYCVLLQIHDGCISISIAIRVWGDNGIDNPIQNPCFVPLLLACNILPCERHCPYLNAGNINSLSSDEVQKKKI